MGYTTEISVNMLKNHNFIEIENIIYEITKYHNCESFYMIPEEYGTKKLTRCHNVYVINFLENDFDNLIKFINYIKKYKSFCIESVYENNINKLLYASSQYLNNIEKEISKKYKEFIYKKNFTLIESKLLEILL